VLALHCETVKDVIATKTGKFAPKNVQAFEAGYALGLKRRGSMNLVRFAHPAFSRRTME
jgi:hypothetical protein